MNMKIKEFTKKYNNHDVVINELNLTKRVTLLVGENGCGKSTLLKGISNFITHEGLIINDQSISYMAEQPIFPSGLTVMEFFKLVYLDKKDNEALLNKLINGFHMRKKLQSEIKQLSKGMLQKVNIIVTLLLQRELYILDEPLTGLDDDAQIFLMQFIKQSTKHFIITSHIKDEWEPVVDEVIVL